MKILPRLLPLLAIALSVAPELAAQPRFIQANSAERDLLLVADASGSRVEDGREITPLDLPPVVQISTIEALADGWVVAGTTSAADTVSLLLMARTGDRIELLPLPPGVVGAFAAGPTPLIAQGALVGLAWLEGDRYDAYAVRSAAWDGSGWSAAITVSASDLHSQLALSGTVLADGSWLLVWSAVDGEDDDIFWSRSGERGSWDPRQRLHFDNDVPDIHPSIVATPAVGALVSWNWFDGNDYRVRLARLEHGWHDTGFFGPAGSVRPSLLQSETGAYLIYQSVIPDQWVAAQLDSSGRVWRHAVAPVSSNGSPVLIADEEGVTFRWPASTFEDEAAVMAAPWQAERLVVEPSQWQAGPTSQSAAEPGAVVYRAFGDSIMRASGAPVFPPIVFDVQDDGEPAFPPGLPVCAPDPDPFAVLCGLNWRLEDQLDSLFTSDVANDGLGGESTPAGVSRIQSVLDDGGDVVLLMEATNDITPAGTSNTTILANLETMVDKATDSGFDTGIASVIKRRKIDAAGTPVDDPLNDQQTLDLRDSIATSLAPSKNRVHIDAWSALDPTLGETDYWDGIGIGDCCGHPDISGYDKMEPFFRTAILADPVLGAPAPIGPAGDVDASPTFSWSTSGNSRLYQMSVTGPGGTTETWYDALATPTPDCLDGTCSVNQGVLAAGSYTWKVLGKNLRGPGPFSADQAFIVYDSLPGLADPQAPVGETFNVMPTYRWGAAGGATQYTLTVNGAGGFVDVYSAGAVCTGSHCESEPLHVLGIGAHDWKIRAGNPVGDGLDTVPLAFEVLDCGLFATDLLLNSGNTGSQIYRACPGSVTSQAGFLVATGETVILHGAASVVLEEIAVQNSATLTLQSD